MRSSRGESSPQEKGTKCPSAPLSTSLNCIEAREAQYIQVQPGENFVPYTGAAVSKPVSWRTSTPVSRSQMLTRSSTADSKASLSPSGDTSTRCTSCREYSSVSDDRSQSRAVDPDRVTIHSPSGASSTWAQHSPPGTSISPIRLSNWKSQTLTVS